MLRKEKMRDPWDKLVKFGKFKGKSYGWVAIYKPHYFQWLLSRGENQHLKKWIKKMRKRYEDNEESSDYSESYP